MGDEDRLGNPKRGVAPNDQSWRPRPIIASFRDDKLKENVLNLVGNIAGTAFRVSVDYPTEIRFARGHLWKEIRDACEAKIQDYHQNNLPLAAPPNS